MPVSIVSNLSSTLAQQAIRVRNDGMTLATQRLSSGQRVFRADQDAAALAVGSSLKVENASLRQAQLNVTSGVSLLQIADGALGQLSNIVTRLQTLATQAASGNLGDGERAIINREFTALKDEVDRVSRDTEFNGVFMLAGQAAFGLQGGHSYAADGIVDLRFDQTRVNSDATLRYSYDATTEQLTLTRTDQGLANSQTIDLTNLLDSLAGPGQQLGAGQRLDLNFSGLGVTMTLGPSFDRTADILPVATESAADVALTTPVFTPANTNIPLTAMAALQGLGAFYNHVTGEMNFDLDTDGTAVTLQGETGIRFAVNGGAIGAAGAGTGDLVGAGTFVDIYVDDAGTPVLLGRLTTAGVSTTGTGGGPLVVSAGQGLIGADFQGNTDGVTLTYKVGSGVIAGQDLITLTIPAVTQDAIGLTTLSLDNIMNANIALDALKTVQTTLSQTRATIGAQQSRMESVGRNLAVTVENNEGARSTLLDADASEEITNLTTDQTMLQVGVSMLSQANRLPDMLLQLLRDG